MGEYVPGFHNGRMPSTAVEAAPCDLAAIAGYVIGPVFEPEVARTRRSWWRRMTGRRSAPAAMVQQIYAHEIDPMIPNSDDAAMAARAAGDAIAAALARLRVEAALAEVAPEERVSERARLFPEHMLIMAMVAVTLGNAAWHFLG